MITQPKKIAFIYDAIFPFIKGGAEKRFYEIGRRLAQDGFEIHFYGMKSWPGPDVIKFEGMFLHGICKNYPLYLKSGRRSIYQAIIFGIASLRLWRESFDIVDCCGFPFFSLFPLRFITWLRKKTLYSTWHEAWGFDYWRQYLGPIGIIGFLIEEVAVFLPDKIISVSDSTTMAITQKLGRKKNIVTISNGLDFKKIKSIFPAPEKSDIIFVGRLLSYKNVDLLIKALCILTKKNPVISLNIIGDGPERKKLEALAEKLHLQNNVKFLGFLETEEEVYSLMRASKILALPSVREGFGIVVLEANACGLPVITVDHPQNAAKDLIVEGVNGLFVELNENKIAEAIIKILQNFHNMKPTTEVDKYDWCFAAQNIRLLFSKE